MNKAPFKVGDYVTSYFHNREVYLTRMVTAVLKGSQGWLISASDGGRCPTCHRPYGHRIQYAPATEFNSSTGNPDNTELIRTDADEHYISGIPFDSMGISP